MRKRRTGRGENKERKSKNVGDEREKKQIYRRDTWEGKEEVKGKRQERLERRIH